MLTAVRVDLTVKRGQTFRKKLEYFEPDNTTPIQMTGWRALMHIRTQAGSSDLLHELSTENGGITLHPTNGEILLYISDEDTAEFTWRSAKYDLKLIYPNGDDDFLCEGSFKVTTSITEEP